MLSNFDLAMREANSKIEQHLRNAGLHKDPVGVKFTLVGSWKSDDETEECRTIAHGKVTGYSIDCTDRTGNRDELSLEMSLMYIFDHKLIYLQPKNPKEHVWTAWFRIKDEEEEDSGLRSADVFVSFDLF